MKADGAVTAVAMDALNNEGLIGTSHGSIFYVNFDEKQLVKIVSKASFKQEEIVHLRINPQNPSIFLTSLG